MTGETIITVGDAIVFLLFLAVGILGIISGWKKIQKYLDEKYKEKNE